MSGCCDQDLGTDEFQADVDGIAVASNFRLTRPVFQMEYGPDELKPSKWEEPAEPFPDCFPFQFRLK